MQSVRVVDGDGHPFSGPAGVIYCVGETSACQAASADRNGHVDGFAVYPNVAYKVFGFAVNTGWNCSVPIGGDAWSFGVASNALGRNLARPTTIVVKRDCIDLHVLDKANHPFPPDHAGIIATPTAGGSPVFAGANPDGTIIMRNLLDPSVEYSFLPYASNINGCTPDYTDPHTGATFWFGTSFTATPFAADGTTFNISDHCT